GDAVARMDEVRVAEVVHRNQAVEVEVVALRDAPERVTGPHDVLARGRRGRPQGKQENDRSQSQRHCRYLQMPHRKYPENPAPEARAPAASGNSAPGQGDSSTH